MVEKIKTKDNSVKRVSLSPRLDTSLGTESCVRQGRPYRHQATVSDIKIGTWNVRKLTDPGKLNNIKQEMKRLGINILGLSEVRWKGAGEQVQDGYRIIYSGGEEHQRGVAIVTDHSTSRSIVGHWPVSDRILTVKFRGQHFNISIIQVYAPTAQSSEEDIDNFYEDLEPKPYVRAKKL